VKFSIFLRPVVIKPEESATPTPNIATNTMPRGAKPVNVVTMLARKLARASPVSKLVMVRASPVRGFGRSKVTFDKSADAAQVMISAQKNKIAGSGILLPAQHSILVNKDRESTRFYDFFHNWRHILQKRHSN